MDRLFILVQYLIPHHLFTRLVGWFMTRRIYKNIFISWFCRRYKVDLSEAERSEIHDYVHFNDFFTRRLNTGARQISADPGQIMSPVDAAISELGLISGDRIIQAKNFDYSCQTLLASDANSARQYADGNFATLYLSPRDYHRVHMPCTGTLKSMTYVPGRLFSVNPVTANAVPGLFARNERLVCEFETEFGPMAVVLVGAMIVAGIETSWAGHICPGPESGKLYRRDYSQDPDAPRLQKGDELGLFKVGSTVILLFPPGAISLDKQLHAGATIRMGETLGRRMESS